MPQARFLADCFRVSRVPPSTPFPLPPSALCHLSMELGGVMNFEENTDQFFVLDIGWVVLDLYRFRVSCASLCARARVHGCTCVRVFAHYKVVFTHYRVVFVFKHISLIRMV